MYDGEHYVTFADDFSDLKESCELSKEQYTHISENAYKMYREEICGTDYHISTNLIKHILEKINTIGD